MNQILATANDGIEALAMLIGFGALILGVCYLVFPFIVMARLRALEKAAQTQIEWLKYTAELQKRQADALEELVDLQRTQSSGPPRLAD